MEKNIKNLTDQLNSTMATKELNFLSSQPEILNALIQSKQNSTSIGIRSNVLGSETLVSCVEDIIFEEGQTIIILKHFDTTGYILPSHKINLGEIEAVYPFATPFVNPFLSNIDKDRTWFF
jgi:hypothetical protein